MYRLSDCFIGDHDVVEHFGANTATYNARYNLQGYPGIRIKCPPLTLVLAGADGFVLETGFEEAGKGKFITLVHDGFLTTYGHLNDVLVQKDERVIAGQLIAHSNQTGLTEYRSQTGQMENSPCLFFGIAPCDNAGKKTRENGYDGYIDPLGSEVEWHILGLKEPVVKTEVLEKMSLSPKEYSIFNAQATNFKIIMAFLKQRTGFDAFLKAVGRAPVNLETTPDDNAAGEATTLYLGALVEEFSAMQQRVTAQDAEDKNAADQAVAESTPPAVMEKQPRFMVRLSYAVERFVFRQSGKDL